MSGYRALFLGVLALVILSIPATAPLVTADDEGRATGAATFTMEATGQHVDLPPSPIGPGDLPSEGGGPAAPDNVGFLVQNFSGLLADQSTLPFAEHDIAVGPYHVLQSSGGRLVYFDKIGGFQGLFSITDFAALPEGHVLSGPAQVDYDEGAGRFFISWVTSSQDPENPESQLYILVSVTDNLANGFVSWLSGFFPMQLFEMSMAVSADKVVQSMDGNDGDTLGNVFVVWDKAEVLAGQITNIYGQPPRDGILDVIAVDNQDASDPDVYLADASSPGSLFIGKVAGPASGFALAEFGVSLPSQPSAPPIEQLNGPDFEVGGTQIASASVRDGVLWVARTIGVGEGEAAVATLEFTQVDVTGQAVTQQFPWGAGLSHIFSPAVTIDVGGNLHVTFNISDESTHPAAYATSQLVSDPPGVINSGVLLKESDFSYFGQFWGGNAIAIDPSDPSIAWYGTSYASVVFGWATWVSAGSHVSPAVTGLLRITTNPAARTTILINGIPRDQWGLNWVKMPPGFYTLEFSDIPEYITPPPQVFLITAGETTTIQADFVHMGQLRVITSPAAPSTIYVDGHPRNDWGMWMWVEPQWYHVCFGSVPGWVTPECVYTFVGSGGYTEVVGVFTPEP